MYEKLERSEGRVLGFEIHDEVTEDDLDAILAELEAAINDHEEPIGVLLRVESIPGVEFGALDEDLGFWLAHRDDIDRYAVVTENSLIEGLVAVEDRLTEMEMREFDPGEVDVAWAWLSRDGQATDVT